MPPRNRKPRAVVQKVGLQREFEKHTETVFDGMKARAKKYGKLVPFTLAEFRAWLLAGVFRGSWDSAVRCAYNCNTWLNALTFVTDHREPVKYGGSFGLENLDVCCASCNTLKGTMSAEGFQKLIEFATVNLHPQDWSDMSSRMKNGAGYLKMKIIARGQAARQKTSKNFAMPPLLGGPR